ncbi:thioesterase II family protein [Cytobacillus dafuensis]|uniref:Thioesterase n=1 Tax=Cytobacillus dafuensis TaxID=1742359 RepID=A0A5B8Z1X3_CYTDA|nr:alpha/beta fold hydrolase [Cytobacillus dafuensis]QED47030.1 thioesterase [Cytobacillus dafuensis]
MNPDSSLRKWCLNKTFKSNPKMRILLFPYACGGASIYRTWHNFFPSEIEVIPIQLPGRENRLSEKPYTSIVELTDYLFETLKPLYDKPLALFGHSMGSLITYELSIRLEHAGIIPAHLFVSAHSSPKKGKLGTNDHLLSDEKLISRLRELSFTPEPVLQNQDLMQLLLPMIRADFTMCETYDYKEHPTLNCPLTVFGGTNDREVSLNELDHWKPYTNASFSKVTITGDHFFVHDQASTIISNISEKITQNTFDY